MRIGLVAASVFYKCTRSYGSCVVFLVVRVKTKKKECEKKKYSSSLCQSLFFLVLPLFKVYVLISQCSDNR